MRTALKQFVMGAYCAGWMPAWVVKVVFFLFRLRAQ